MRTIWRGVVVTAMCVPLALAGCSFWMQTNPNEWTPEQEPECSSSLSEPITDLIVGAALATSVGVALSLDCAEGDDTCETDTTVNRVMAGVAGLASAVYLLSSGTGFGRRGRCLEATRQHDSWREHELREVEKQRERDRQEADRERKRREAETDREQKCRDLAAAVDAEPDANRVAELLDELDHSGCI